MLYLKIRALRGRFKIIIKILKPAMFFISFFILTSCAVSARDILPNQASFAQIQSTVELEIYACKEKNKDCELKSLGKKVAFGSGNFFVYKNQTAYLSAAHVCLGPVYEIWNDIPSKSKVKTEILLKSYTGKQIKGKIKYVNLKYDLCVVEISEEFNIKKIPKISLLKPKLNKKFYTLAAPYSIFHKGVVPLMEGRYFGSHKIFSFFSIASGPGASGAAIFNSENMIVGIIQRTHLAFNEITLSIKHKDLIDCLDSYLDAKEMELEILIE